MSPPLDRSPAREASGAWAALGWLGLAFLVLGIFDVVLGLIPAAFGNPEWTFGTASAVLNGFAIPTMGAYLLLASLVMRGERAPLLGLAGVMLLIGLLLLTTTLLFLTVVPVGLESVRANAPAYLGLQKAVAKAIVLAIAYVGLFVAGAIRAWGASRRAA